MSVVYPRSRSAFRNVPKVVARARYKISVLRRAEIFHEESRTTVHRSFVGRFVEVSFFPVWQDRVEEFAVGLIWACVIRVRLNAKNLFLSRSGFFLSRPTDKKQRVQGRTLKRAVGTRGGSINNLISHRGRAKVDISRCFIGLRGKGAARVDIDFTERTQTLCARNRGTRARV